MASPENILHLDPEEYAAYIKERQSAEAVNTDAVTITTPFSRLSVRRTGGFIAQGALGNPDTLEIQDVFFAEPDHTKPKLTASHLMSPVGPYDGPGGQHGASRWLDHSFDVRPTAVGPELTAGHSAPVWTDESNVYRRFMLGWSKLKVATVMDVFSPKATSVGHHDYYHLRDGDYEGLTINGKAIDELLDEPGATEEIMSGNARLWEDFGGVADVRFPDGTRLGITANAEIDRKKVPEQLGMLLWRRPDAPYICLEPTVGVRNEQDGGLRTDALVMGRDEPESLHFTVETELLSRDA